MKQIRSVLINLKFVNFSLIFKKVARQKNLPFVLIIKKFYAIIIYQEGKKCAMTL
jgi:hypothetical protein